MDRADRRHFLAQQAAVIDSVQRLRQWATAAGSLTSTPQQTVSTEDQQVTIEPMNPEMLYVPYYDPTLVYGAWPWPDYPPFYFPPPLAFVSGGAAIGFSIGLPIFASLWGWHHWDWHRHQIIIDGARFSQINVGRPPAPSGAWQHDPAHRRGVPYRDAGTAARFRGEIAAARRDFLGFATARARPPQAARLVPPAPGHPASGVPTLPGQLAPAFESFGRGTQVRHEAARGFSSRSAAAPGIRGDAGALRH
jgi:hypothetical protein